jgi:hypothetical protein
MVNTSAGILIATAEAPAGIVVSDTVITGCPGYPYLLTFPVENLSSDRAIGYMV